MKYTKQQQEWIKREWSCVEHGEIIVTLGAWDVEEKNQRSNAMNPSRNLNRNTPSYQLKLPNKPPFFWTRIRPRLMNTNLDHKHPLVTFDFRMRMNKRKWQPLYVLCIVFRVVLVGLRYGHNMGLRWNVLDDKSESIIPYFIWLINSFHI